MDSLCVRVDELVKDGAKRRRLRRSQILDKFINTNNQHPCDQGHHPISIGYIDPGSRLVGLWLAALSLNGMAHDLAQTSETTIASTTREDGRLRRVWRNLFPFVVVGAIWEVVAHAGLFPPRFFPPLEAIAAVFARLTMSGVLPHHALDTLVRLMAGFALAALVGVTIGILMGRSRRAEDILLPLVSIGAPIPGLAYAPLFLLWFGPGNVSAIALVAFVSTFPIIYNSWTGVKAVKDIWVRSAQAMGANDRRLFRHVILPGALPYIMTGLRLGLAQAWRILVGIEMLAAVSWGLGWLIFGAQEFLNTDVMLAGIVVIALIGLTLEKLVFERLEQFTVVRWGMLTS
jgi:ABC-type nitrate/sulfonate/bicarbonate transport system permease component